MDIKLIYEKYLRITIFSNHPNDSGEDKKHTKS